MLAPPMDSPFSSALAEYGLVCIRSGGRTKRPHDCKSSRVLVSSRPVHRLVPMPENQVACTGMWAVVHTHAQV